MRAQMIWNKWGGGGGGEKWIQGVLAAGKELEPAYEKLWVKLWNVGNVLYKMLYNWATKI